MRIVVDLGHHAWACLSQIRSSGLEARVVTNQQIRQASRGRRPYGGTHPTRSWIPHGGFPVSSGGHQFRGDAYLRLVDLVPSFLEPLGRSCVFEGLVKRRKVVGATSGSGRPSFFSAASLDL